MRNMDPSDYSATCTLVMTCIFLMGVEPVSQRLKKPFPQEMVERPKATPRLE